MAVNTLASQGDSSKVWAKKSFAQLFTFSTPSSATLRIVKSVSSYKRELAIFFNEDEISALASPYQLCLIGEFSHGKSSKESLHKEFYTMGFKAGFCISWLDQRHVLIRFDIEEDYMRLKGQWNFQRFPLRVCK